MGVGGLLGTPQHVNVWTHKGCRHVASWITPQIKTETSRCDTYSVGDMATLLIVFLYTLFSVINYVFTNSMINEKKNLMEYDPT